MPQNATSHETFFTSGALIMNDHVFLEHFLPSEYDYFELVGPSLSVTVS